MSKRPYIRFHHKVLIWW